MLGDLVRRKKLAVSLHNINDEYLSIVSPNKNQSNPWNYEITNK